MVCVCAVVVLIATIVVVLIRDCCDVIVVVVLILFFFVRGCYQKLFFVRCTGWLIGRCVVGKNCVWVGGVGCLKYFSSLFDDDDDVCCQQLDGCAFSVCVDNGCRLLFRLLWLLESVVKSREERGDDVCGV